MRHLGKWPEARGLEIRPNLGLIVRSRVISRSCKLARLGWRFWDGWVAIFCVAVALSTCDTIYLLWVRGWDGAGLSTHAFAVELWAVFIGLTPIAFIAGLLLVAAGPSSALQGTAAVRRWASSGSEGQRRARAASLFSVTVLFVCGLGAGAVASFELDRRIVQPRFRALAIALAIGAVALVLAGAYPLVRRVFGRLFAAAAPLPVIGWPMRGPLNLAVSMALVGGVGLAFIGSRHWQDTLAYVPWFTFARALAAAILAFALYQLWRLIRERPAARGLTTIFIVSLVALLSVPAFRLSPLQWEVRRTAFDDAIGGRAARSALRAAFDRDNDGFVSFLGDGDCEPGNPRVYYGASEVPDNGVDENCDGEDLAVLAMPLCRFRANDRPPEVPAKLDIVLVTIDALAATRLGISGYERGITPNLDAFAHKSVYFEAAFSQGPSTRLSLPAMFTSKWDSLLKRVPQPRLPYPLAKTETQLAESLSTEGYDTVAIVSDRNFVPSYWPSATRGFADVDQSAVGSEHNSDRVTSRALDALHRNREQPLFLWVHYYDPHSPYHQPEDTTRFGASDADIYDAEILYTDRALGPLLDTLELRPDTLTIITSDHGTVFHPRPQTRKAHYGYDVYTATLHIPMLFHAPFLTPGSRTAVVSTLDIYPTLADLLPMKDAPALCGESLAPMLLGSATEEPRTTFHQFYLPERAARDGKDPLVKVAARDVRYNLILNRDDGSYELYDWTEDYFETENLVASAGHRDAFLRLRREIAAFLHSAHDWREGDSEL